MNIEDLPDNSDSSDEDYIPEGNSAELPSEEESDGDAEDPLFESEDVTKSNRKRQRKQKKTKKKQKTEAPDEAQEKVGIVSEEKKQQTANLWADFIKDTGFKTRAERSQTSNETSESSSSNASQKSDEQPQLKSEKEKSTSVQQKTKITEIYKFAGEEIKVEKEVSHSYISSEKASVSTGSAKRQAGSGRLGSILNQIGKKNKINTLEKSKMDWDKFKKEEDIEDELQAYGKSKDGYLEKQDFLNRADLRRFEIEKDIRNSLRTNKMNN